ncbi:MAG TPA: hypothetical protein VG964_03460 [Candidatus Saccharimonadales bacterium]|nr:hypothetical protein [Candidatus Saccharimonadales bacterium]
MDVLGNIDAGFGTASEAEMRHLLPQEVERMNRLRRDARSAGSAALSTEYVRIGVETTGETTREERRRLAEQGISSHPIGWGVAFSRRIERSN